MPAPSLARRASARVFPSSSRSEISTGQLSTIVIAAHLLPHAGAAVLRLAVTPPSSARRGSQVKGLDVPARGITCCRAAGSLATQRSMPNANHSAWSKRCGNSRAYPPVRCGHRFDADQAAGRPDQVIWLGSESLAVAGLAGRNPAEATVSLLPVTDRAPPGPHPRAAAEHPGSQREHWWRGLCCRALTRLPWR